MSMTPIAEQDEPRPVDPLGDTPILPPQEFPTALDPALRCRGCARAALGLDRIDHIHERDCPQYDAFFDATDEQLIGIVREALQWAAQQ